MLRPCRLDVSCGQSQAEQAGPIVIVEDDDGMRRAIERLLQAAGYATRAFPSAEAVLLTRAAHDAACLLFDVHLPGLSGLDLRARLTAEGARAPVVFVTAHDDQMRRDVARQAGATAYLLKPFAGKDLLDAVARACAGHTEME